MNVFDSMQVNMIGVVNDTFGYDATWQPLAGGPVQHGRVLWKDPTKEYELNDVSYSPFHYCMEYFRGTFEGLIEAVRLSQNERVSVHGNEYWVRQIHTKEDGKTYIALLELITA